MITEALEAKFLRYMYERQIKSCGYGIRNLEGGKLSITHGEVIEKEIPEIFVVTDGMRKSLVVQVATELQAKGLVQFSPDNVDFWLTPTGYAAAEKTCLQRRIDYLNKNPGWSIPISVASLIISLLALFSCSEGKSKSVSNTVVEPTPNGPTHVRR